MTVVRLPREYREPPPPEREPQLELWPGLPATPRRATPSSLLGEIRQEFAALYEHVDAICAHADAFHQAKLDHDAVMAVVAKVLAERT